eukprot:6398569-Alexandrium_andersonii.AAC.1
MPTHMSQQVEKNPSYYFDLWLRSNKDWGQVECLEQQSTETNEDFKDQYRWMRGDEIDKEFPPLIAQEPSRNAHNLTSGFRIAMMFCFGPQPQLDEGKPHIHLRLFRT